MQQSKQFINGLAKRQIQQRADMAYVAGGLMDKTPVLECSKLVSGFAESQREAYLPVIKAQLEKIKRDWTLGIFIIRYDGHHLFTFHDINCMVEEIEGHAKETMLEEFNKANELFAESEDDSDVFVPRPISYGFYAVPAKNFSKDKLRSDALYYFEANRYMDGNKAAVRLSEIEREEKAGPVILERT